MRAQPHPPAHGTAQRVARGGHQNGRPEQPGVELDEPKHGGLGTQRQQRGRNERHHEHRAQSELRQGQPVQQLVHPQFHGARV
ncbi:hypothetical protein SDC9_203665 [bioreactor metagenome]|uniref:Uncharacterized protein n=1 Tax=bioreactor metagenome TaxID=1076179 RepID=A0A645IXB6_9ZZZZ